MDAFSKWVEAIACHKAGALTVAKKALESVFFDWDTISPLSPVIGKTLHWANHISLNENLGKTLGIITALSPSITRQDGENEWKN